VSRQEFAYLPKSTAMRSGALPLSLAALPGFIEPASRSVPRSGNQQPSRRRAWRSLARSSRYVNAAPRFADSARAGVQSA